AECGPVTRSTSRTGPAAPPSDAAVLLVGGSTLAGAALALAPWPVAAAATAMVALLWRRVAPRAFLLAAIAPGWSAVRSQAELSRAAAVYARAVAVLTPPARCVGRAVVVRSPVVRGRSTAAASDEPRGCVDIDLEAGECNGGALDAPIRARV